jgi:hypothetical protein
VAVDELPLPGDLAGQEHPCKRDLPRGIVPRRDLGQRQEDVLGVVAVDDAAETCRARARGHIDAGVEQAGDRRAGERDRPVDGDV